jgi:hypothetical protein
MAYTYLFFRPSRLPLATHELSEQTVLDLQDPIAVRAELDRVLPDIEWIDALSGRTTVEGQWLEFRLPGEDRTLSLRCSLRADYARIVQKLCDDTGWLAFDQTPLCYQPNHEPIRA